MHPVITAQLNEFSGTYSKETFSQSEYFEAFCINSIANGLMGLNIDPFDAHLEASEFGIDGIAIIVQGDLCADPDQAEATLSIGKNHSVEFLFFQSKTSEHCQYGDLAKFLHAVVDFFEEGKLASSPQIDDLRACKDLVYSSPTRKNPSIQCAFCTTGTGEASTHIEELNQRE